MSRAPSTRFVLAAVLATFPAIAVTGCADASAREPTAKSSRAEAVVWPEYDVSQYDRGDMWVCRPDLPTDACRQNRDATEMRTDGSRVVVPFAPLLTAPAADCFYVYPTVDMAMAPGNHTDFSDTERMKEWTFDQVGRFGSQCRIFAPLYRQMTIGTYFASPEEHARRFDMAYGDVLAAFQWFLAHVDGHRPIVLVGHSQGAQLVERLLQKLFDGDSDAERALRSRLAVAMPIGGDVQVADGSTTGGTFRSLPLCTSPDELGCVVAFGTFLPEGVRHPWPGPPPAGHRSACVNPADVGGSGRHVLSGTALPTHSRYRDGLPGAELAETPFFVMPDFYAATCTDGQDGFRYLAIEEAHAPGDTRASPLVLDRPFWRTQLGLHILDMQLTQGDLVQLVGRKTALLAAKLHP